MNRELAASNATPEPSAEAQLRDLVEEVARLLPEQAPLKRFVHHNTLHALEHLPFEQAVLQAARLFATEPYPSEAFLAQQWAAGRLTQRDLDAVLEETRPQVASLDPRLPFADWTRSQFRRFRLAQILVLPSAEEIRFQLEEGDLLQQTWSGLSAEARQRFLDGGSAAARLAALWHGLAAECPPIRAPRETSAQPLGAAETLLIRFCGAYLDQGLSYWPMPERQGLWHSFLALYGQTSPACAPWLRGISARLRRLAQNRVAPLEALKESLERLGIPPSRWRDELLARVLPVKGWAGMVRQLQRHPELAPLQAPPLDLIDLFAILLELQAHQGTSAPLEEPSPRPDLERIYEAFVLAQLAGLGPTALDTPGKQTSWLREVEEFPALERRRLLFLAYERRYRVETLDALARHQQLGSYRAKTPPRFQAVFCIDDREESLRRHLEELSPEGETFGMAGFFGVRMVYQGLHDVHPQPLCPGATPPRHLVREVPLGQRPQPPKPVGWTLQTLSASRHSALTGGLLAGTVGLFSGLSLLGRTLAPRLWHRLSHAIEHLWSKPAPTRLQIERAEDQPANAEGLWEGFTVTEMTEIVREALTTLGVTQLAPLVLIVGHGSSSLNNPHEAAHDCGATGGGRGGPNARALAAMANRPSVRRRLAQEGQGIPESTWFVGAYHNTCDDSLEYYDLDLLPDSLRPAWEELQTALNQACAMDAHERCRRFDNAPLELDPAQARRHVERRTVTLAQPRPEYGHCTNAVCLVGRRQRTRGLFLDRRAFLVSYNPEQDPSGAVLGGLLASVAPVGAGISLEYYFSSIDSSRYGCGTKLPHNITGLLGVMDGHCSDLRTGLPWQMVEIHEPMRLLLIVESLPDRLQQVLASQTGLRHLVERAWVQLVAWSPEGDGLWTYHEGRFVPHRPESLQLPVVQHSRDYYAGHRRHLGPARILAALGAQR